MSQKIILNIICGNNFSQFEVNKNNFFKFFQPEQKKKNKFQKYPAALCTHILRIIFRIKNNSTFFGKQDKGYLRK